MISPPHIIGIKVWIIVSIVVNVVNIILASSSGEDHLKINIEVSINSANFTEKDYRDSRSCRVMLRFSIFWYMTSTLTFIWSKGLTS